MQARKSWNQGSVQSHVACWSSHGCLVLFSSLASVKLFVFDSPSSPVCRASFSAAARQMLTSILSSSIVD